MESKDSLVAQFLRLLKAMPAGVREETPVLADIAELCAGNFVASSAGNLPTKVGVASGASSAGTSYPAGAPGLVRRRLDRRYARIRVVYSELSKLDFKKAKPEAGFEDFVFDQTNFDIYNKIGKDDFNTFFDEGLEDYDDSFYRNNFMMSRSAVRKAIFRWYKPAGEHYSCDTAINPLLLGIMRTIHTSLDFAPLIRQEEAMAECRVIIRFLQDRSTLGEDTLSELDHNFQALYYGLIRSFDKLAITHSDGMVTTLSIHPGESMSGDEPDVLYGTFHPFGKAHTIALS
ncbi:hypothetical protein TREPR_0609 [Treponema primitia ZAS-2]|uniref:Uncharacterized protein n=1 Tax=Treponema primitia (strain ATCC BAA-887 / DSM 12427 / ZAS-2) TaxID=545694 RepID=F5YKN4_TREPZ|nr:hypothetical protein [Treponema primitia]AEF84663.1 hypothetical protein TREPR_0609 [Treponema primitia ZAS-2]